MEDRRRRMGRISNERNKKLYSAKRVGEGGIKGRGRVEEEKHGAE